MFRLRFLVAGFSYWIAVCPTVSGQESGDFLRQLQFNAVDTNECEWCHWGDHKGTYSTWTNHSNRLIPVYTWGLRLDLFKGKNSCYRDEQRLMELYGSLPPETLNPDAEYFDQTDIYRLQQHAALAFKKNIVLIIFDGMDWQTTQAAANYLQKKNAYGEGRGNGLSFLDYQNEYADFGFCVTSPYATDTKADVNAQVVTQKGERGGGYSWKYGGSYPWSLPAEPGYLLGKFKAVPHGVTDSASSATSICSGIKTFNAAINMDPDGNQVEPIARTLQKEGYSVGVVTSVPVGHATPGAAYANNVTRNDYQDLARDLLGLRSVSHPEQPLPGVDVLIGCGWGSKVADDRSKQGNNYVPGNKYLVDGDLQKIDVVNGGKYQVATRTGGQSGAEVLRLAARKAALKGDRLFGFFGTTDDHLPYRTADGKYDPTRGVSSAERYKPEDIFENPTLADMTDAALRVLSTNERGFWLMIEAGDVDWANHNNNVDDSIGAVISGDMAFRRVIDWVEANSNWNETALILTADHGHLLFVDQVDVLCGTCQPESAGKRAKAKRKAKETMGKDSGEDSVDNSPKNIKRQRPEAEKAASAQ